MEVKRKRTRLAIFALFRPLHECFAGEGEIEMLIGRFDTTCAYTEQSKPEIYIQTKEN